MLIKMENKFKFFKMILVFSLFLVLLSSSVLATQNLDVFFQTSDGLTNYAVGDVVTVEVYVTSNYGQIGSTTIGVDLSDSSLATFDVDSADVSGSLFSSVNTVDSTTSYAEFDFNLENYVYPIEGDDYLVGQIDLQILSEGDVVLSLNSGSQAIYAVNGVPPSEDNTDYYTLSGIDLTITASSGSSDDDGDGYSTDDGDCDDSDASINPGVSSDTCDGVDNDCDGSVDEDATSSTYYSDSDGDGYGDSESTSDFCSASLATAGSYVTDSSDCDDTEVSVNFLATEMCDGIDNDCDGEVDEDDALDATTWYVDSDGDGYGTDGVGYSSSYTLIQCNERDGYVVSNDDCNDASDSINPGVAEICGDGVDNDCSGSDLVCSSLVLDYNNDRSVGPGDVIDFIADLFNGEDSADLVDDGVLDFDDVKKFIKQTYGTS